MLSLFVALHLVAVSAQEPPAPSVTDDVVAQIESTRAGISEDERRQRETLSNLFIINKKVREIARRQERLNQKLLQQEATVRTSAQDVQRLELRKDGQRGTLNKRLRQLYQERDQNGFYWLFSAQTPVELERNHRFLRRMADSDHRQLKVYLSDLVELRRKRAALKEQVTHLAQMQKEAMAQEKELGVQLHEKARLLSDLKKSKDLKLTELKDLREKTTGAGDALDYAFFERKGALRPPVETRYTREYGTYVDPQFRFRLTHKGLFYSTTRTEVRAIYKGRVAFASDLPGYGSAVIVDHGDNYYSVYAFAGKLKVREGSRVSEGDVIALSGEGSRLFGPGLYFEIRHFTDAIDPRPWIKESLIKTADSRNGESL